MTNSDLPQADVDRHEMQRVLGEALSRWGRVEGALNFIFQRAVTAERSESASAAFGAVRGFEVQTDMTNAAMRMTFRLHSDVLDDWKVLYKQIDKLRPKRNRLAHGQVVQRTEGEKPTETCFVPFYYGGHHLDWSAFEKFTAQQVQQLSEEFAKLSVDMFKFGMDITFGPRRRGRHSILDPEPRPTEDSD